MALRTFREDNSTRKGVYVSNFYMAIIFGTFGCLPGMLLTLLPNVSYSDFEKNQLLKLGRSHGTGIAFAIWMLIAAMVMIVNGARVEVSIGLIIGGVLLIPVGIALFVFCVNKYKTKSSLILEKNSAKDLAEMYGIDESDLYDENEDYDEFEDENEVESEDVFESSDGTERIDIMAGKAFSNLWNKNGIKNLKLNRGDVDKVNLLKERDIMNFTGFMGVPMNEQIFAEMQKKSPWFQAGVGNVAPLDLSKKRNGEALTSIEMLQFVFAKLFGSFGFEKNLDEAEEICKGMLSELEKTKPTQNQNRDDEHWMCWQNEYGQYQIQLGTVYAYRREVIKAAYHFMLGLKSEMVQLNIPYSDFIRYIISKLDQLPKSNAEYFGYGFVADKPMGCTAEKNSRLDAQIAMDVIPEMEGEDGEVIVARNGNACFYGYLERHGSAKGGIDIYDTWLIDKAYNLKNIKFFFNGYQGRASRQLIVVADGFRIKPHTILWDFYNFIGSDKVDKNEEPVKAQISSSATDQMFPSMLKLIDERFIFLDKTVNAFYNKCMKLKSEEVTLTFSGGELVENLVDFKKAEQNLPGSQYNALIKFIDFHKSLDDTYELNKAKFANLCLDIYTEMNMIAPRKAGYAKIITYLSMLGQDRYDAVTMSRLREEAADLIEQNKIDTSEWSKFYDKFYRFNMDVEEEEEQVPAWVIEQRKHKEIK